MKKYVIQKTIEAEPMFKHEAESKLNKKLECGTDDSVGYLVCDMEKLKWNWIQEEKFEGVPFDTPPEQLLLFLKEIRQWTTFFKKYNREKPNTDRQEQLWVYNVNKHLRLLNDVLMKILNKNYIDVTTL